MKLIMHWLMQSKKNQLGFIIAAEGDIFCAGADLRREESESNVPKLKDNDDLSLAKAYIQTSNM